MESITILIKADLVVQSLEYLRDGIEMKKTTVILLLLSITACTYAIKSPSPGTSMVTLDVPTSTSKIPITTETAVSLPTQPQKTGLPENAATATPLLQPTIFANLPIESRCLVQPEVHLQDMGLRPSDRLIVYLFKDGKEEQVSILDRDLETNPLLQDLEQIQAYQIRLRPDKQWIAVRVKKEENNYELWVSSVDGKTRMKILGGLPWTSTFFWTNNQTIISIDRDASAAVLRIDPFLPRIEALEPVILDLDRWIFAFSPDASQVIYLPYEHQRPTSLLLHDYATGEEQSVFPGLDPSRIQPPFPVFLNWGSDSVSLAFKDGPILDLALNVPLEQLAKQRFPQQRVLFPDKSYPIIYNMMSGGWLDNSRYLSLGLAFRDGAIDPTGEHWFYILDTERLVLYDYCIPSPGLLYASSDERFLAWGATKEGTGSLGTYVLEIATGIRAWIEGWIVLEWGEVPDDSSP